MDYSVVEEGDAAEGPGQEGCVAGVGGEGVDVVVDEALEGVEAVRAGGIDEGEAGRVAGRCRWG